MIDLIYCAGGNARLMSIAADLGWQIGIRSDRQAYDFPVTFVDIDYKRPDFTKHLARVVALRPRYAIVPDLRTDGVDRADIMRALGQMEQLARFCEVPLLVPKIPGQIALLPVDVAIAYSIPTSYGGARYGLQELAGRRVHLLGGNPKQQQRIARWIRNYGALVTSADGNMAQVVAQKASYWRGAWKIHEQKGTHEHDLMYDCFALSLQNIKAEWLESEALS